MVQVACKNTKSVIVFILTKLKYIGNNLLLGFSIYLQIITFMLHVAYKNNKCVACPSFMQTGIIHNFNNDARFWPLRAHLCIDHHENPYGGWYVYWQLKFQILLRSVHWLLRNCWNKSVYALLSFLNVFLDIFQM